LAKSGNITTSENKQDVERDPGLKKNGEKGEKKIWVAGSGGPVVALKGGKKYIIV